MSNKLTKQLINQLPEYERSSKLIAEILYATSLELANLNEQNEQNYEELFIDTAVKALQIHARDLGISIDGSLSLQQQRALVTAYYRAAFDQTTEDTIKSVASAFSDRDASIRKTSTVGVYEITFDGTVDFLNNVKGLQQTINTIIPAHLDWNVGSEVKSSACAASALQCGTQMTVYPYQSSAPVERETQLTRGSAMTNGQTVSIYPKGALSK